MTVSLISVKCHDNICSSICYDELNNIILTVCTDGTVKMWSGLTDKCIKSFSVSNNVNCMQYEKERIFIASSSSNIVESFSTHNITNVAIIAQFLSEVNYIAISRDKTCFLACSSDKTAKIIQLNHGNDDKQRDVVLNGHEGPIVSGDIDIGGVMVATASCDGSVIVWRAADGAKITELSILDEVKDVNKMVNKCRVRFSPSEDENKVLAVPRGDGEVLLIDCDDWSVRGSLSMATTSSSSDCYYICDCIFSIKGDFLVTSTSHGHILVWHINSLTLVDNWSSGRNSAIISLLWYPIEKDTLLFCDISGYWQAVKVDLIEKKDKRDILSLEELNEMFDEEDFNKEDFIDEQVEEEERQSSASTVKEEMSEEEEEDDDEFNISLIKAEFNNKEESEAVVQPVSLTVSKEVGEFRKKKAHPLVRPGAAPRLEGVELLFWNSVGALKKHYDDGGDGDFLEVVFHDSSVSRTIIIKSEIIDCDMGDISTSALLLLSDYKEDSGSDDEDEDNSSSRKPSVVLIQSIDGSCQPWTIELPIGESPVSCCLAGDNYAIVLTRGGLLRYFSLPLCGLQSYVESVYGTPVAIVGDRSDRCMAAVVIEDGEKLMCRLEKIHQGRFMNRGRIVGSEVSDWFPLPISDNAKLVWIGFSDGGILHSVDSKQIVRRLQMSLDSLNNNNNITFSAPRWSPVLHLKQSLDKQFRNTDRYFPVGFIDSVDAAGCLAVHCRSSRYPRLLPWPHLTVVPFKIPLCVQGHEETVQLENSFTILHMLPNWSQNTEKLEHLENEMLLKLFFNALTQDSDHRALSIAELMADSSVVQLAIRAAVRQRKMILAEKLGRIALSKDEEIKLSSKRQIEEEEEDEYEDEEKNNENEEEDESEDKENDGSSFEEPITQKKNVFTAERLLLTSSSSRVSSIEEKVIESPFRVKVAKTPVVSRRGIDVVDKKGTHTKKASPKKSTTAFGTFVPSPSSKTFKIKSKRKSTLTEGSPFVKKLKE